MLNKLKQWQVMIASIVKASSGLVIQPAFLVRLVIKLLYMPDLSV
ncbi:hypothetical protein NIES4071_54420 [Calothrix sp. NIES-4071]|nr:hypothetical protein NIES4071_54420 [Calothrix sp. NIES-4071]BAZ59750.1 hypothetical protein NIES4105_54370 [Calothrix sp. NIES-4105]